MTKPNAKSYPLRLPASLKAAVEKFSKEEGTSINQFVVMAVAEKISAIDTAKYFEERAMRADFDAFDRIMNRDGGKAPPEEDRQPPRKRKKRKQS